MDEPATKGDIQEILKAIGGLSEQLAETNDIMQRQFAVVLECIDTMQKDIDELRTEVRQGFARVEAVYRDFDARLMRCERRLGIAA